ncbi:MAG: hypothetical protein WBV59_11905 [Anaerolineae bacterium]
MDVDAAPIYWRPPGDHSGRPVVADGDLLEEHVLAGAAMSEMLSACVICGATESVSPTSADRLFEWGIRDFNLLRPAVICGMCDAHITMQKTETPAWAWLQARLPKRK